MKFEKVIGQYEIKEKLVQSFTTNRLSHSYLFYGIPGTGKLSLAIAFAQFLSCENKTNNDSCGECPSCKKYEKLIHPDLHFVFPVVSATGKKSISDSYISQWREIILEDPYFSFREWMIQLGSENKQGGIFSDESSEILRKLNLKTFESDFKNMIIWLPEKMNISCANKLLKILEEPPQNTLFILVSDNSENILQTIRSRTQPVKILGIDDESLKSVIINKYNISSERADDIVKISNGSLLEAEEQISLSDETKYNLEQFINLMRICYARKVNEAMKWAEDISKTGREMQKSFLHYCCVLLRENFAFNFNLSQLNFMTHEEEEFAKNFAKFINIKNVGFLSELFNLAHFHIERNGNAKIIFTDTAFNIMKILKK
ncbi:MAG TPA: DNA polymerase III subunit delta [Bacteroidales bacterium]|nr:DNA polymerase III subunit delta [Bacteroidales bacterium]